MVKTIAITNFGGRLSRIVNGNLNSGFSKFATSWGYDPFSKPMNLTWLERPSSVVGISDLIMVAKNRFESNQGFVYMVGEGASKVYKIQPNSITSPNLDSVIGIGSVATQSYAFGASVEFFGTPERMFVGGDSRVVSIPISSIATFGGEIPTGNANQYLANTPRPLKSFQGKLVFGNGPTIGVIDNTNTVTSSIIGLSVGASGATQNLYSQISPSFSPETIVQDLDVSPDYNYLLMSVSDNAGENLGTVSSDRQLAAETDSTVAKWNGVDQGITAALSIPSLSLSSLQTYLQNNITFSNDSFGMSLGDGVTKILNLPNNKAPFRNATGVNGNFVFWANVEVVNSTTMVASLYYFGHLDQENPSGLYRLMRYSTALANGFVYGVPVTALVNNKYSTVNTAVTSVVSLGYGKHYFSTFEINNSNATISATTAKLHRFLVTPTGTGTSQAGVYETQTQLFSKRIGISQIRVYTEPTAANNGFQIDLIGSDDISITGGTFTYTFAAGSDETKLLGALERVNFNPSMKATFALGVRVTNTGSANMTIKKIEIDYIEEGK